MRKTTLLTLAFSSLLVLPAMAQLGQVWDDFQVYSVDVQNYLRNNVNDTFRPLDIRTQGALNSNSGELNVPDPLAAGKQVRDDIVINSLANRFENNAAVNGANVSSEINRFATRSAVSGVIGTNGQRRIKGKLEETQNVIRNINDAVDEAERANQNILDQVMAQIASITDPTQRAAASLNGSQTDLLLRSLRVQRDQSRIISETIAQTVQTNQSLQYSNLNLANISQQIEESNRARRVDSSAEAARLLRTSSQIDLFGRTEGN